MKTEDLHPTLTKTLPLIYYRPLVYTGTMTPIKLKAWRKHTGFSQSQLARILKVDTMTVSRWERGVREIPSFLHLALECIELKGMKTKKERKVKH